MQRLLDDLSATPAIVLGRRMDILAWNPWLPPWSPISPGSRKRSATVLLLFTDLAVTALYPVSETLKRGTLVKNIRHTGRPDEIECNTKKVKGLVLVLDLDLKTAFLKKA